MKSENKNLMVATSLARKEATERDTIGTTTWAIYLGVSDVIPGPHHYAYIFDNTLPLHQTVTSLYNLKN